MKKLVFECSQCQKRFFECSKMKNEPFCPVCGSYDVDEVEQEVKSSKKKFDDEE